MLKVAALLREEAVAFVGLLLILDVSLIERRGQSTTYVSSDPARASGDTKLMPTLTTLRSRLCQLLYLDTETNFVGDWWE